MALVAAALLSWVLPARGVTAQDALLTLEGFDGTDFLPVAAIGDTNGDGRTEILVGDPSFHAGSCSHQGRASLHSGADGALVFEDIGPACDAFVGFAVSDAGDQDGDGRPDFLVSQGPTPPVVLRSGADGSILHAFSDVLPYPSPSLARLGDVDDDGIDELVIGTYTYGPEGGLVRVYRGGDFSVLLTIAPEPSTVGLGISVASAGDIDHDRAPDVIVGAAVPFDDYAGSVHVYSGRTGAQLLLLTGEPSPPTTSTSEEFGRWVAGPGDVNGDGTPDILVGLRRDFSPAQIGKARLYSGADGSFLFGLHPEVVDPISETVVSSLGDVDLDGYPDVAVGDPRFSFPTGRGRVILFSGRTGAILKTIESVIDQELLGNHVAPAGDFNDDGFPDLVVAGLHTVTVYSGRIDADPGPTVLLALPGAAAGDEYGAAVARAGDVDGDFRQDFVVGAPGADTGGLDAGVVTLVSGQTGDALFETDGVAAGERFGSAVDGAGDVDGDGRLDVIAGAPSGLFGGQPTGIARVLSGADGSTLREWHGEAAGDGFGSAVLGIGDVDGDGAPDLAVGAPTRSALKPNAGALYVFSGATGGLLHQLEGATGQARLGRALAPVGDLDRDGRPDLLVGAPGEKLATAQVGAVRVVSGATGAELLKIMGAHPGATFGQALAPAGDFNRDAQPDFLVGSPGESGGFLDPSTGAVRLFSGADGSLLEQWLATEATSSIGSAVAGGGDLDADGIPDLLLGVPHPGGGNLPGRVLVVSGADASTIETLSGSFDSDQFGSSLAVADVNGDGFSDAITGAPAGGTPPDLTGEVTAASFVDYWEEFPGGVEGGAGVPRLSGAGSLVVHQTVTVTLTSALPSAPGIMVAGLDVLMLPFRGGVLVPSPDVIFSFACDATGAASFTAVWPQHWPPGVSFYLQAWLDDAAGPQGFSASNALQGTPH